MRQPEKVSDNQADIETGGQLMMVKNKSILFLFAIYACGVLIGCGGDDGKLPLVSVKGKVTLDGKPHGPATLTLQPTGGGQEEKRPVIGGIVEADGSFALTTYTTGDGAPPGDYEATLGAASGGADANDPTASAMAAMGGGGPSTAPLKVTVPEEGSESLEINFVSAKQKKKPMTGGVPAPL